MDSSREGNVILWNVLEKKSQTKNTPEWKTVSIVIYTRTGSSIQKPTQEKDALLASVNWGFVNRCFHHSQHHSGFKTKINLDSGN